MMYRTVAGLVVIQFLSTVVAVRCALAQGTPSFLNGSFESPAIPGLWWDYPTSLPGWTAGPSLGALNIHGNALWSAQHGVQHLEFDATTSSISQTVTGFEIGGIYEITFAMAGNPDIDRNFGLRLSISSPPLQNASADYFFDSTNHTRENIGWVERTLRFTATSDSKAFRFNRIDGGATGWGPQLDNVRLSGIGFAGDWDVNGLVDGADLLVWQRNLGSVGSNLPGDGDLDNDVDATDLQVWKDYFGHVVDVPVAVIPEPGAILLIASAIATLCGGFRRKSLIEPRRSSHGDASVRA